MNNDTEIVKGTKALILSLMEHEVDTIFGYPGGSVMPIYDELYDYMHEIRHILVRHEQGAVHAAEGYARSSGKVGVCLATAGPGATNLITGIADAMMDSTPIVCISAQVNADKLGTNFFQEADTIGITLPITKWSYQITEASEIPYIISKAFAIASSGRPGPVVISITKNAQMGNIDLSQAEKYENTLQDYSLSEESVNNIDIAIDLLNAAKKPLIIAGQGVTISKAEDELLELAQKGNIPVVTTLLGLSAFDTQHPLYFGNVGMHGHLAPNKMTQEADVILAIGMRFSDRVTGEVREYAEKAKIIHIDIDRSEINKIIKVDIGIQADAKTALTLLNTKIETRDRDQWLKYGIDTMIIEKSNVIDPELYADDNIIRMSQIVSAISRVGNNKQIVVADVGQNQMFSARYSKFSKKCSWLTSGGLGTMGYGLPAAIGAKVANPDREVVVIAGDGGIQMNIQELGTIMQSDIRVKIVVLNNSYLGMIRQWQEMFFDKRYSSTHMANPDFVQLVSAYGIEAERISCYDDMEDAVKRMYDWEGAYLLEVIVESEESVFPMIPPGATLNGIITNK